MISEKYILTFYGLNTKYYTDEYIARLWEESANKEYLESGIYITSFINVNRLVCGELRGCKLGDTAYTITASRNPVEIANKDAYRNSFINVAKDVKEKFGNPYMSLAIQDIDVYYFTEIK